ncbi:MAG: SMC family ATPase [Candidatus Diapherotrites archaeon]|nr:SMC family ATPase [Candidatus Diapherotrites archaeon]
MIKRIRLENWKSHEDSEFEFAKGTNVIVGVMGAGKTSIMDAISFALFGTFPALQGKKLKLDDCIKNKPEQKQDASIELGFSVNGDEYEIRREIRLGKGTSKAELRKNGQLLETQGQRSTELVRSALRIDYELFSRAVYSEQNQMDYFLQIPSGQRKRRIDELLRIDRFEEARKNATTLANRLTDRKKLASDDADALKKRMPDAARIEQELKELESEKALIGKQLTEQGSRSAALQKEVKSLEEKSKQLNTLKSRLQTLQGRAQAMEKTKKDIEDKLGSIIKADLSEELGKAEENEKRAEETIKEKKASLEKARDALTETRTKHKNLREEADKVRKDLSGIREELRGLAGAAEAIAEARAKAERIDSETARTKAIADAEEERLRGLAVAEGKCPVCDSPLDKHTQEELEERASLALKNARAALQQMSVERQELQLKKLEESAVRQSVLKEREKNLLEATERFSEDSMREARSEEEALEKTSGKLSEEYSDAEKSLQRAQEHLRKIERIKEKQEEHAELGKQLAMAAAESESIKKESEAIGLDEEELKEKQAQKEEAASRTRELAAKLEGKEALLNEKAKSLEEARQHAHRVIELEGEAKLLDRNIRNLNAFRAALESTQAELREEFTSAINAGLEDIWPRVYPYADYSSLRLSIEGSDYALQLRRRDGDWVNVEGIVSGGERSTACLVLRIAFALVLTQNLSWLVLDEPTHNLDQEGVGMLATALREHLPELVDQTFIITHDEGMEQAVSGRLYRLHRDKSVDGATSAEVVSEGED